VFKKPFHIAERRQARGVNADLPRRAWNSRLVPSFPPLLLFIRRMSPLPVNSWLRRPGFSEKVVCYEAKLFYVEPNVSIEDPANWYKSVGVNGRERPVHYMEILSYSLLLVLEKVAKSLLDQPLLFWRDFSS